MPVVSGEFHLFVPDPTQVETHLMRYRMLLAAPGNQKFFFDGFKVVRHDGIVNIWHDTTTLYITVFREDGPECPVAGKGILHILPKDFAYQLTTIARRMHSKGSKQKPASDGFSLACFSIRMVGFLRSRRVSIPMLHREKSALSGSTRRKCIFSRQAMVSNCD